MFLDRPGNRDRLPARWERTLKPLNSHADANRSFPKCEGHKEATFNYNDSASDEYADRVVGQERADGGWGSSSFIAHSDLNIESTSKIIVSSFEYRKLLLLNDAQN